MKPRHFVYLLTDGTFQKVGRTTSPKRRIVGLQSGNPRPLEYLALWHVTDDMAQHAENMCVVRFRQFWALPIKSRKRPTEAMPHVPAFYVAAHIKSFEIAAKARLFDLHMSARHMGQGNA